MGELRQMPPFLTSSWLWIGVAALAALWALARARKVSRRLDRLTESYWELRYEHGQLRARLARLEGQPDVEAGSQVPRSASTAFVPLSSLRK